MKLNIFLKNNLISGFQNNSFTQEQVVIFAMNYLNKAQLTQDDVDEIMEVLFPNEEDWLTNKLTVKGGNNDNI